MYDITIVLYEYTEILLGKRKNYSDNFFNEIRMNNEQNAIEFIRMATKAFLRCNNLDAARATVTPSVIKQMKLDTIINHIKRPRYVYPEDWDEYVLARVFDDKFNTEKWIAAQLCKRISKGSLNRFPKFYMNENLGLIRSQYCLRYFISMDIPDMKIIDLYRYSTSAGFSVFLKKRLLFNVKGKLYSSPVEFMHLAINRQLREDILYYMYEALYYLEFQTCLEFNSNKLTEGGCRP